MVMKHAAEGYSKSIMWSLWSVENLLVKIHSWNPQIRFQVKQKIFQQLWIDLRRKKNVTTNNVCTTQIMQTM